jgi:hypothetical protein
LSFRVNYGEFFNVWHAVFKLIWADDSIW